MFNLLLPLLALGLAQEPCNSFCNADINDDGVVNIVDLQTFLRYFDGNVDENTDLIDMNCDGLETITDYTILLSFYGQTLPGNLCK